MKIDTHNHTYYSPDGGQSPQQLVDTAISRSVGFLCVTEHLDNGYPTYEGEFFEFLITKNYFEEFNALREKHRGQIDITIGVEIGYTKENERDNADDVLRYPYEYIINSVHIVDGDDVYRPEYYKRHSSKQAAYTAYLEVVRESLFTSYDYDAIGHLGYVARYADYADNRLLYDDFADILDDILKTIIKKDKILEINSSVGGSGSMSMPDISVIQRYYDLGGRKICFGSDSHDTSRIARNYDDIALAVKRIGFTDWTVKQGGKHKAVKI